ncbi:MAG: CinA family nicotinamide mononucleotide deamidase-related protein [Nonlabens sp.]
MKATLITIGDEILIGQIVDTNSAWMARELNKIGVEVYEILSISDSRDHLVSAFAKAEHQSDIVLITGGLGPTSDDVTKLTICNYLKDDLILNHVVLQHIESIFKKYVKDPILEENKMQAMVPSKATVLMNEYGTAPGMWMQGNHAIFVCMPGVPFEMKSLMKDQVLPRIAAQGNLPAIYHRTIITTGKGESTIAQLIRDVEENLTPGIKLAYLPAAGQVRVRLSSRGTSIEQVRDAVDSQVDKLYHILGPLISGEETDEQPVERLSRLLREKGATLSTAESCTGGKIAGLFTQLPGASSIFNGSTITYATASKVDVLVIDEATIDKHSVVSAPVAMEMATGVKRLFKTDYAISTTGNAGPTKGDSDAAIGTVFIGIATPTGVTAHRFNMGNHRERIVSKSIHKALELLGRELLNVD